jgi:hypothetical protein
MSDFTDNRRGSERRYTGSSCLVPSVGGASSVLNREFGVNGGGRKGLYGVGGPVFGVFTSEVFAAGETGECSDLQRLNDLSPAGLGGGIDGEE